MYIQHKFVVTSIFTLCMLTVSFLLSSLTILLNSKANHLSASRMTQNNTSALLIESMPESCETTQENETCLRLNLNSTVSSTRRQKNRLNNTRQLVNDEGAEKLTAADAFDKFSANITTIAIMIPEPTTPTRRLRLSTAGATTAASEPIVSAMLDNEQLNKSLGNPVQTASLLACEMATRQARERTANNCDVIFASSAPADNTDRYKWVSSDAHNKEGLGGLNCVCVELYRDNGDAIPNPDEDQFMGFTLIMNDSSKNPDYYQFTNLPPGTYFAKLYSMTDLSAAEAETNILKGAIAIDQVSQESN